MAAQLTQWDLDNFESKLLSGEAHHFSAHLIRLIRKADFENKQRLARGFLDHIVFDELFSSAQPGSRIWRCTECGGANLRHPSIPHPAICTGCKHGLEPPLPPRNESAVPPARRSDPLEKLLGACKGAELLLLSLLACREGATDDLLSEMIDALRAAMAAMQS